MAVNSILQMEHGSGLSNDRCVRLVKGSHIVVPRIVDGDDALILQNKDGRVIFVLPYEEKYSLIGTTDIEFYDAPETVSINEQEVRYLLDAVASFCRIRLDPDDIVWSYSGVRPLFNDETDQASKVTRDYRLELAKSENGAAVLSVFGGKITTYRALAEDAMSNLKELFPGIGPAWTEIAKLPGGDIGVEDFDAFVSMLESAYSQLSSSLIRNVARRHGSSTKHVIGDAKSEADLGKKIGHNVYEREVFYLKEHEWAKKPEDVLWRRTKAGLHLDAQGVAAANTSLEAIL